MEQVQDARQAHWNLGKITSGLDDGPGATKPTLASTSYERLLTPADAAEVLGVSPKQLANWRSKGGGPLYARISHKVVMYRHQALMDWAMEREFRSAHEARLYDLTGKSLMGTGPHMVPGQYPGLIAKIKRA